MRAIAWSRRVFPPEFGPVITTSASGRGAGTSQGTGTTSCRKSSGLKSPASTRVSVPKRGRQTARPFCIARSRNPSAARYASIDAVVASSATT